MWLCSSQAPRQGFQTIASWMPRNIERLFNSPPTLSVFSSDLLSRSFSLYNFSHPPLSSSGAVLRLGAGTQLSLSPSRHSSPNERCLRGLPFGSGLVCVSVLDLSARECYVREGSLLLSDVMNRSQSLIVTFFVAVELWTKSGSSGWQGGYHVT